MVGPARTETRAVLVTAACGGVRGKLSLGQGLDTAGPGHWQWAGPGRLVAVTWQASLRPGGEAPGAARRLGWTADGRAH